MSDDYKQAMDYLYGFVNFEHKRIDQYSSENITLERSKELLKLLGDPQDSFRSIHIAGTKGKGSVAAMVTSIQRSAGQRVGLYTSPHLQEFRDRIRVISSTNGDGRITPNQVVHWVDVLKPVAKQIGDPTWYELVTAMAFLHFANEEVDVAVVEVGLGGRLDATNVLTPLVSVITSLSLDHTALLGNTVEEIAREKGGIIKPGIPVITASQEQDALYELQYIARNLGSQLTIIGEDWLYEQETSAEWREQDGVARKQEIIIKSSPRFSLIPGSSRFKIGLIGQHQLENAVVALAVVDEIHQHFPTLDIEDVREGLLTVEWPGRIQVLAHSDNLPTIVVDCAHNVDSSEKLVVALRDYFRYEKLLFVVGVSEDKDVKGIFNVLFPLADHMIVTASSHPRAHMPEYLLNLSNEIGFEAIASPSVATAIEEAWTLAGPDDLICATGSIFVVGDLLNQWESLQSELKLIG